MIADSSDKVCTLCRKLLPATVEYFGPHKKGRGGFYSHCKKCRCIAQKQWCKDNPDKDKSVTLKKRYGITFEEYSGLFIEQGGKCAICEFQEQEHDPRTGKKKLLAVDHDHITGKIRGLLCSKCNRGIGLFYDNVERMKRAIDYISRFKK
jgi:hypothetical protein